MRLNYDNIIAIYAAVPRSAGWSDVATTTGAVASSVNVDQAVHQPSASSAQVPKKTPPKKLGIKHCTSEQLRQRLIVVLRLNSETSRLCFLMYVC